MARIDKQTAVLLSESLEEIYAEVVDRLIVNICKHLTVGDAKRTADWEVRKLQEIGQLSAENAKIINEAVKQIPKELRSTLEESRRIALNDLERRIEEAIRKGTIERAPRDSTKEILESLLNQAADRLNLVNTVMLESSQTAYVKAINDVAEWETAAMTGAQQKAALETLDAAVFAQTAGTETRQQMLAKAISQLTDNGIYGFVDRAGRRWTPEAYVSMDVRTTCHNTAIESIKARQQDYGSDIFQISEHAGARPLCYPYQGKFYTWGSQGGTFTDGDGKRHTYRPISSTSYGKPAGIFGINCGHYPIPQISGVTIPQSRKIQNKAENDKEYQESQEQRLLERQIREAKRKEEAFKAAGLTEAAEKQKGVIAERQAKMREFIRQTGRSRRYDREKVYA